jgi:hypothetical protein
LNISLLRQKTYYNYWINYCPVITNMNLKRICAIIGICILFLFVYTDVRINLFKAESLTSFILAVVGAISIILTGIVFKNNKEENTVIK